MTDELSLLRQFRDSIADIKLAVPSGVNSGQWASKKLRELRKTARVYRDQSAPFALAAQSAQGDCDLCSGKCRGHPLGHPEEWEPEPESRAAHPIKPVEAVEQMRWRDMDDAPFEKWALVEAVVHGEQTVVEAMQYRRDGWMTFGCNGGIKLAPTAWMPMPRARAAIRKIDPPSLKGEG